MDQAPEGDDWLHELKYDGYRILARLDGGQGHAGQPPRQRLDGEVSRRCGRRSRRCRVHNAILDGEVAVPGADGRTSFQALQNALGQAAGAGRCTSCSICCSLDGEDLTGLPLEQRKQAAGRSCWPGPPGKGGPLRYSDHVVGQGRAVLRAGPGARAGGDHLQAAGRAVPARAQHRLAEDQSISRQEFVIGGFTDPEGSRSGIGALLVGYYDRDGQLHFAGKVGTGFTQKTLAGAAREAGAAGAEGRRRSR